jgi:catecholate siderophore receptor
MKRIATILRAIGLGFSTTAAGTAAHAQTASNATPNDKRTAVETVKVTGQRSSLDKLTGEVLNTPQDINIVPKEVIQQQGVTTLQAALKNVPGITLNAGEGGAHGDQVNLRGFSASDDFFLDGLRDTGFYTRDTFDYDAIEVYKGPASTLFGRGSTGGVINQVTKMPTLYPLEDGVFTIGSNAEYRASADINYPIDDSMAIRLNAMGETSHVTDRDFAKNRRWGVAPSFAYGLDTPTTVTLAYLHQYEDNIPDFGIPFLFGEPAPVKHDAYFGLPADDRQISDVDVLTGTVKHDFNGNFSISDRARWGNYYFDTRQTSPIYGDATCYPTATAPWAGAPLCTGAEGEMPVSTYNPLLPVRGMPLDQIFVLRDRPSTSGTVRTLMNETDATWKFDTGPLNHALVFGVEVDREEADLVRYTNQDTQILPTPLLHPDPHEAFPGTQTAVRQRPDTTTNTVGLYAVDTISLGEHWQFIGALRWDDFDAKFDEPITDAHFQHTDDVVSPRAALIYKPTEESSLYVSYGTSFDPSAENLSLSSRNADLAPEKDRTYEAGAKTLVLGGLLSLGASVFDTEMTNARIADPFNPGLQALAGEELVRGLELDASGHLTEHWELTAGYTYLDASSKGLFGTGVTGPIPNTAHDQANLWTTYDFDSGWKLGAGANYISRRAAFKDTSGEVAHVPGYLTFDGMVGWQITDNLQLQGNAYNLLDKQYFSNVYFSSVVENHVVPAPGRYFTLSALVSF